MSCLICSRIEEIKEDKNPYFVAELDTGYVVLGDFQFFNGYTLFLSKQHVCELFELKKGIKERFLIEMSLVAEAVFKTFQPLKLNYECLGNAEPHLHWHIFPRYEDDPSPKTTSWKVEKEMRYHSKYKPSAVVLSDLKKRLIKSMEDIEDLVIHKRYSEEAVEQVD